MTPKIITHESEPDNAWLVDMDSVSQLPLKPRDGHPNCCIRSKDGNLVNILNGKTRPHFETALHLHEARAGQFCFAFAQDVLGSAKSAGRDIIDDWQKGCAIPRPVIYAPIRDFRPPSDPMSRDIPPEAARALLHLVSSKLNVTTQRALGTWKFGENPAIEGVDYSWSDAKFIVAWLWGKWRRDEIQSGKKMSRTEQWEIMKGLGYESGLPAFRSMISRLGLVVAD